jgi:hypothetical protein
MIRGLEAACDASCHFSQEYVKNDIVIRITGGNFWLGVFPWLNIAERQFILGEGSGLVGTKDLHAGHFLDRFKPGSDDLLFGDPRTALKTKSPV